MVKHQIENFHRDFLESMILTAHHPMLAVTTLLRRSHPRTNVYELIHM